MPVIEVAIVSIAALGHLAVWIAILNRLHGVGWPERLVMRSELVIVLLMLSTLAAIAALALNFDGALTAPIGTFHKHVPLAVYFWLCFGMAVRVIGSWAWRLWRGMPRQYLRYRRDIMRVDRQIGHSPCADVFARWLVSLPGNQATHLEIAEKTVLLPHLPKELDGLVIVHLSDLHLTGRITREYYELVVEQTNAMRADIVAITGDTLDEPKCLPWITGVFGRLQSRYGTYCVLGNHERRLRDVQPLLAAFAKAGIQHVGGRCVSAEIRGLPSIVAGNEMPWFQPSPELSETPAGGERSDAFRLLLSHSPDRVFWARARGVDLMLAGHTHGGQIRLPMIGPILGHSLYGLAYCSGVFYCPPTLLHVSRGTCHTQPLRIHCRPELVKLVVRSPEAL